jgi:Tol biopolymer transport system component
VGEIIRWGSSGEFVIFMRSVFKPDGNSEETIDYFDLSKMKDKIIDQGSFIPSLSLSPDNRLLTYVRKPVVDGAELVVFDLVHNCVAGSKKMPGQDGTASWSPDGSKIIIGYFGSYYFVNVEKIFGKPFTQLNCSQ